jgi:hypothetical protein
MSRIITLGLVAALLACAGAALAFPTVGSINETTLLSLIDRNGAFAEMAQFSGGPTGGLQLPTADVATGYQIAIDRSELEAARFPSVRFLAGFVPNLEMGLTYEDARLNTDIFATPALTRQFSTGNTLSARVWGLNAKYVLPFAAGKGKIALGAQYNNWMAKIGAAKFVDDKASYNVYLAGTWPVMTDAKLTATVVYTKLAKDMFGPEFDESTGISGGLGLERMFPNKTKAGVELILNAGNMGFDQAKALNYANAYVEVPINGTLTGRAAFSGIGQFTTFDAGVCASWGGPAADEAE